MGVLSIHCLTTQKSTAVVFGIAFGYSDVMDENRRRLHLLIIKSKAPPTSLSDLEWTLVQATPLDDLPQLTKYDAGYWSCNVDAAGSITAGVGFERTSPVPYVIMRFDPAGVEVNSTYITTEPNWWQASIPVGFNRGLLTNTLFFDLAYTNGRSLVYHASVNGKWVSFSYLDTSSRTMRPLTPWDLSSVFHDREIWGLVFGDKELYVVASGVDSTSFTVFPVDITNDSFPSSPPTQVRTHTWTNAWCDITNVGIFHTAIGKTLSIVCPKMPSVEVTSMLFIFNGTHTLPPVYVDSWTRQSSFRQLIGVSVEGDEKGPYLIMREMEPPPITSRRLLSSISCNPKSLGVHTRGPLVNITDDYHVLDSGPVTLGQVGQVGTSSLPVGAIIGIAIGVLAVLALICFIFIRWRRMALTSKPGDESIQKQPENDDEEMTMQGKAEMDKSSVENDKVAMEQDAESMAIGNQNDEGDQIGDKRESPSMQSRVLVLMNEPGRVERSHGNRNNGNFSTMDEWIPKPFDPRIYEQVHTPTTERVWTFDHVHIPADEQAVSTMTNPTETPR